jgi:hypothetical protein
LKYFWVAAVLVVGEALAALVFHFLKKKLAPSESGPSRWGAVVKGLLERGTVLVGLLAGFPHVLTAFGALKISTRLRTDAEDHISNTYFLAGNLLSILFAMVYAWIVRSLLA